MRETFISILALLAVAPCAKCSDVGKDGFNFYKDYLRARTDDVMSEGPAAGERMLYFYRTPLSLYPGLLPAIEQEYRKRTGNAFKNHMLSKELWTGDALGKRDTKTALSLIMHGKHPYYADSSTSSALFINRGFPQKTLTLSWEIPRSIIEIVKTESPRGDNNMEPVE